MLRSVATEHVAKLRCEPLVAERINDLLNESLEQRHNTVPLIFKMATWQLLEQEKTPMGAAAIKQFPRQTEELSLLSVMYTVCESRIDPSHPAHRYRPDWGVLAYMLRYHLVKNGGELRAPLPFEDQ